MSPCTINVLYLKPARSRGGGRAHFVNILTTILLNALLKLLVSFILYTPAAFEAFLHPVFSTALFYQAQAGHCKGPCDMYV